MSGGADDRGQSEIVEGTITSVVYHNDENGYTVLHVEPPSNGFELARGREITIVGKAQAVWEGEDVRASGRSPVPGSPGKSRPASPPGWP